MNDFRHIRPEELDLNVFRAFADDWALITAVNGEGKANTMVGGWGGFGYMWKKPVYNCVIRPQRYTFSFAQESDFLTLTFFGGGQREALKLLGSKSGRDGDKIAESGLTLINDGKIAYFDEAETVLVGKKLYVSRLEADNFIDKTIPGKVYPAGDYHYSYVCEITDILVR